MPDNNKKDFRRSLINGADSGSVLEFTVSRASSSLRALPCRSLCPHILGFAHFVRLHPFVNSARTLKQGFALCGFSSLSTQIKSTITKCYRAFYGASIGIELEKYCIEFAELTIHETDLMEQVYKFLFLSDKQQ